MCRFGRILRIMRVFLLSALVVDRVQAGRELLSSQRLRQGGEWG